MKKQRLLQSGRENWKMEARGSRVSPSKRALDRARVTLDISGQSFAKPRKSPPKLPLAHAIK